MLPISAKDTLRFTPPHLQDQPSPPVYLLAVPTIRTRAAFRRELAAEGAAWHDDDAALQGLRDALGRQFAQDQDTNRELQAVLDRFAQARREALEEPRREALDEAKQKEDAAPDPMKAGADEVAAKEAGGADAPVNEVAADAPVNEAAAAAAQQAELRRALARQVGDLEMEMRRRDPAFARLLAEREHYLQIAPLIAAQMFLRGWENVGAKFDRRGDRATDDCLMRIPEDHLTAIGWKAMSLFRPQDDQAKN